MPRFSVRSPLVLALAAYDIWRRLPPKQRQQILDNARKHGPRLAAAAANQTRKLGSKTKPK